jgi:hypothetical protein
MLPCHALPHSGCVPCFVLYHALCAVSCFVLQVYGSYYRKLSKRVQSALAEANAVAEEVLSAMSTVSMFMFMAHSWHVHGIQLACSWHHAHGRTYSVTLQHQVTASAENTRTDSQSWASACTRKWSSHV